MEKGQPNPQRRARSRAITSQSTSSSSSSSPSSSSSSSSSSSLSSSSPSTFLSNKFQPNPKRYTKPSNPSNVYSKNTNTQQQQQRRQQHLQLQGDGEEDLTLCSSPSSIVGTCPFMCPVEERVQRERLRDLSVFERLNGSSGKSSPSLAVKKMQASDVRPLPVLEDTLNYLLNLLDSKEHPFEVVHEFIFDRTRSIRQDLSMQNVINNRVIQMFEKMVKFHVMSHHKLRRCSGNPNVSSMYYLNMEQLTKALASLYHLYEAIRSSQSICENEAEFHSLYVLLHLGSDSKPTVQVESLSLWFRHASTPIIKSKEMCFARRVLRYYRLGNYRSFICTTAAEASYLQYCIIEPYINEVRALAVSCINYGGYKLHPYPLADLSKLLMMKESDVESLCRDCGLEFVDELGKKYLPTKQASFCRPKGEFQTYDLVGSGRF